MPAYCLPAAASRWSPAAALQPAKPPLSPGRVRGCWVRMRLLLAKGAGVGWQNDAAGCSWQCSCKSPSTLQKCNLLITRQLTFGAVLGELNLCSPSTRLKVNHLCIRYLCFESVRGDFLEGHSYASRCQFPVRPSTKLRFLCSGCCSRRDA